MYSPAGFDATLDKWKTQGVYARIKLLDHLPKKYSCIVFDRREPRGGPWASVIRNDRTFADAYAKLDAGKYKQLVTEMCRTLFDRDTSPGAEPEDLLKLDVPALVVPGRDTSHATSAARYLEECLPKAEYWDVLPDGQTEETAPTRVIQFLDRVAATAR